MLRGWKEGRKEALSPSRCKWENMKGFFHTPAPPPPSLPDPIYSPPSSHKMFLCPPSAVLDAGLDSPLAECDVSVQIALLIQNSTSMLRRSKVRTLISKLSALFVKAGTREVYK